MKPYYEAGGITLYRGDCREVLQGLTDKFDLVFTSPPYNMGLVSGATATGGGLFRPSAACDSSRFRSGYGVHGDAMDPEEYTTWQQGILALCWGVLSDNGAIYYNHRPRVLNHLLNLPLGLDFRLPLRQIIVWDRGTGVSVNQRSFASVCEWIFVFAKPGYRLVDKAASGFGDVWRFGPETKDLGHPAPFPLALPSRAIRASADVRILLDPFAGSGTSLVAARDAGLAAVGVEIEERYCEIAARRLEQGVFAWGD